MLGRGCQIPLWACSFLAYQRLLQFFYLDWNSVPKGQTPRYFTSVCLSAVCDCSGKCDHGKCSLLSFITAASWLMLCFSCPSFKTQVGIGRELSCVLTVSVSVDMPAGRLRCSRDLPQPILHPGFSHPSSPLICSGSCWHMTHRGDGKRLPLKSATNFYPRPKATLESVISWQKCLHRVC